MGESMAQLRIEALQQAHQTLKEAVKRLERHAYLTPTERQYVSELKKQKLAAKDQIELLKREL
jgi:uncharacterized protein YdcH (DUF465 family)